MWYYWHPYLILLIFCGILGLHTISAGRYIPRDVLHGHPCVSHWINNSQARWPCLCNSFFHCPCICLGLPLLWCQRARLLTLSLLLQHWGWAYLHTGEFFDDGYESNWWISLTQNFYRVWVTLHATPIPLNIYQPHTHFGLSNLHNPLKLTWKITLQLGNSATLQLNSTLHNGVFWPCRARAYSANSNHTHP